MTKPEEIPPTPLDPSSQATPPKWIWHSLMTGAALTVAANYLIYSRGPGAGWAVFFLLMAAAIFTNRRSDGLVRKIELVLSAVLAASTIQMVVRPSFSNAVVLFTLTLLASTHFLNEQTRETPAARKLIEALRSLLFAPTRWIQATHVVASKSLLSLPNLAAKTPSPRNISRTIQIIVPAILVTLPFLILLGNGNSVLGQSIINTLNIFLNHLLNGLYNFQLPSPERFIIIGFIATALLGLLWHSKPSRALDPLFTTLGKTLPAPSDHFVSRWRTILILVGVNALFFTANSIDLTYLGANALSLPDGLTYSQFVHRGTYTLIASAIVAAIVLGLLFQQDKSVTDSRTIHGLAIVWIAQNILLIINVARRVGIYISDYDLSILRVHLLLFLALVCVGFALLAIRILADKSFGWLVCANLTAVFVLFASLQFWDTRKLVAEYNLELAVRNHNKTLDVTYLTSLGPSAWPSLIEATQASLGFNQRKAANIALESIKYDERSRAENEDWRDFTLVRSQVRRKFVSPQAKIIMRTE